MDSVRVIVSFEMTKNLGHSAMSRIQGFAKATRANPGCEQFELVRDQENPDRFSFLEKWQSHEAVDLHTKTPYFRDFATFLAGNVANLKVRRWEQVL